jgi:hypothetical protein
MAGAGGKIRVYLTHALILWKRKQVWGRRGREWFSQFIVLPALWTSLSKWTSLAYPANLACTSPWKLLQLLVASRAFLCSLPTPIMVPWNIFCLLNTSWLFLSPCTSLYCFVLECPSHHFCLRKSAHPISRGVRTGCSWSRCGPQMCFLNPGKCLFSL